MNIRGMGVSLPPNDTMGNLEKLKNKLIKIEELGFEAVELSLHGMDVIRNGVIDRQRLEAYRSLLSSFSLRYTTHAPYSINLFRKSDTSIERASLIASLEVSGAVGAETMVYHVGRYVGEEEFLYPHTWFDYTKENKQELLVEEQSFMRKLGQLGQQLNVRIAMENMRPYLDCPYYCYAVIPSSLVEQVEAINHPFIGITLDVGHLYLSHKMYGLDLLTELRRMVPHVIHLHVHDNYGKTCFSSEKNQYELAPIGRGDMHMPIGDGEIPMGDIFKEMPAEFNGYMIHEVRERYESEWSYLRLRYETAIQEEQKMNVRRG
jgi:sugar phosphate isomerase/epimerase